MYQDDVINSEYIEEEVLQRSSMDYRNMLRGSNLIADDSVKHNFKLGGYEGGTGGATNHHSQVENSQTHEALLNASEKVGSL